MRGCYLTWTICNHILIQPHQSYTVQSYVRGYILLHGQLIMQHKLKLGDIRHAIQTSLECISCSDMIHSSECQYNETDI